MKKVFHVKPLLVLLLVLPTFAFAQHFTTSSIEAKPLPVFPQTDEYILNTLAKSTDYNNLSQEQKDWFYWTNYSRSHPQAFWDSIVKPILGIYPNLASSYTKSLQKDLQSIGQLPFVYPNPLLIKTAQGHASDLSRKRANPSHESTNGDTFQARMTKAGVQRCAAENISFGPSNVILSLVFLYIDEKLPDLGHRKNLLSPIYTQMGIGTSTYPNNLTMTIQDFSCDQSL